MASNQDFYVNTTGYDINNLFVLAEYYHEDDGILVHHKNIEKLNKKHGCNVCPMMVGFLYADDYDKAVAYINIEIGKVTGKRTSNLVHIWGLGKGKQMPEKKIIGRIAILDVHPKNIADKEPNLNDPLVKNLLNVYQELDGMKPNIKKGKK